MGGQYSPMNRIESFPISSRIKDVSSGSRAFVGYAQSHFTMDARAGIARADFGVLGRTRVNVGELARTRANLRELGRAQVCAEGSLLVRRNMDVSSV